MKTLEQTVEEIVAAAKLDAPEEIFRAGLMVVLFAYGLSRHKEGFDEGRASAAEEQDMAV